MENTSITGLDELEKHLDGLLQDPALIVNAKLLDNVELQLTETNILPLLPRFLPRLTTLLKQYTQDPTAIVNLTIRFLGPVPFEHVFAMAKPDDLIQALDSPAPAANLLGMTVLHKAAADPDHLPLLSAYPELVAAFLRRWLAAPQVEVGQKGAKALGDLLDIDCPLPPPAPTTRPVDLSHTDLSLRKAPGHGALWSLLFQDKETYTLLLDLISGRHPETAPNSSPTNTNTNSTNNAHQLSLAQGRILRLLPRLAAIDLHAISHSQFTPPAPVYANETNGHTNGLTNGDSPHITNNTDPNTNPTEDQTPHYPPLVPPPPNTGLLQYVSLHLIQKSDTLMHLSLIDFFETLLALTRISPPSEGKLETLRALVAEAVVGDNELRDALVGLPERTVEEEEGDLRGWLGELGVFQQGEVDVVMR
ncbi:hypothetical protein B0J18DRAFT_494707 [Chaetomium sp. MPI-SDFR-AT-0129]|nr:hypothetical protein B0J18DRAFT_494707 [Chaetomium sp. MPI-SDFR-AT-0129]